MAENKVRYGLSNVHLATYTEGENGTVTIGTPIAQPGAVNLQLDPEAEENTFWADNVKYHVSNQDNGFSGSLEVAKYDSEVKQAFLGYITLDNGTLAHIKGFNKPKVCLIAQAEGDSHATRFVFYNVTLGPIQFEANTTEDAAEPATETVDIIVAGDRKTGIDFVEVEPSNTAVYDSLFTAPPVPALPANAAAGN